MIRHALLFLLFISGSLLRAAEFSFEIGVDELQRHVYTLASEAFQGRKPATAGNDSAAAYIRRQLYLPNVFLLAENGYQPFSVVTALQLGERNELVLGDSSLTVGRDFMPFAFSESGVFEAPVVFAGYGFSIHSDSLVWDDYESVDVSGKWVLVLAGDLEPDEPKSLFAPYSAVRSKAFNAKDHGAAGVLAVAGRTFDAADELPKLSLQEGHASVGLPVIRLKREAGDRLPAPR